MRDIAGAIGHQLDLPVASVAPDEAAAHFRFLAGFVSLDNPTSSAVDPRPTGLAADPSGPDRRPG